MDFNIYTVKQLSAHLRSLRRARGLTQAGLGQLLGVKQSRIADIEKDPGSISVAQLHTLLAALGTQMVVRDTQRGWLTTEASAAPDERPQGKERPVPPCAARPTSADSASTPVASDTPRQTPPGVAPSSRQVPQHSAKKQGGSW